MNRTAKAGRFLGATVLVILCLCALAALTVAGLFRWVNRTNGELVSSGETRRYLLFVPSTYDPGTPTPLVISLHGFVEWPAHQMQISGWNDLAEESGFLVVYPEGTGVPRRWRAGGWASSADPMIDVAFISDLIDTLAQDYNIDPRRVYANGLSNGGGMAYLLGCGLANRIAAIGGVAGAYAYPIDDCQPARPVPMIAFHGTADAIVPYGGGDVQGPGVSLPSVPGWVAAWAALNGCDAVPSDLPARGEVSAIRYTGCDQGADVEFYTIAGGGHTWPGGEPMPAWIVGHTTRDLDATRAMWDFFRRFALQQ